MARKWRMLVIGYLSIAPEIGTPGRLFPCIDSPVPSVCFCLSVCFLSFCSDVCFFSVCFSLTLKKTFFICIDIDVFVFLPLSNPQTLSSYLSLCLFVCLFYVLLIMSLFTHLSSIYSPPSSTHTRIPHPLPPPLTHTPYSTLLPVHSTTCSTRPPA